MSAPRCRTGFTLLEVVVALAVGGAALAAGTAAFAIVVDRVDRVEERMDRDLAAAAVRSRLAAWVGEARLGSEGRSVFSGVDAVADRTPDDELSWTTGARTPVDAPRSEVRLYVDRDAETLERGLVAEFRDPITLRAERDELVPEAIGLDIRYRSAVAGSGRWLPSWISSSVLPRGVEIRIQHGPAAVPHPLLELPIRVPVEGGR